MHRVVILQSQPTQENNRIEITSNRIKKITDDCDAPEASALFPRDEEGASGTPLLPKLLLVSSLELKMSTSESEVD